MIDFTPQLSAEYMRTIEAPNRQQFEIDIKAAEILRELENRDISELVYDMGEQIRDMVRSGNEAAIGPLVRDEINAYCQRIAARVLGYA